MTTPHIKAAQASPSVKSAIEHARAQYLRSEGEHRSLWPTVDFGAQYALFSTFNNYQNYYIPENICTVSAVTVLCPASGFQKNNATIGANLRIPLFNATQRAPPPFPRPRTPPGRQPPMPMHSKQKNRQTPPATESRRRRSGCSARSRRCKPPTTLPKSNTGSRT